MIHTFDLSTQHLGDFLLALPAMRQGDRVICHPMHHFGPAIQVQTGRSHEPLPPEGHKTQAWLSITGREAIRHRLMAPVSRYGVLLAPAVSSSRKAWGKWGELRSRLGRLTQVHHDDSRSMWMHALNRAEVVICPDTGTAHMADALGCPKVIALYGQGESHFQRYKPFWSSKYCIVRDRMADITVDDVLRMVHG